MTQAGHTRPKLERQALWELLRVMGLELGQQRVALLITVGEFNGVEGIVNTTRRVLPEMKIPGADLRVSSSAAYLTELNREQRAAVEHGVEDGGSKPLLVIAGAGSGKTKTLAHRVAHLIVNGADPRRILLLTFSRRSAAELARRVLRILQVYWARAQVS